jgi:hypothetical protein
MSDIVERLRLLDADQCQIASAKPPYSILGKAADEIESLRSRLVEVTALAASRWDEQVSLISRLAAADALLRDSRHLVAFTDGGEPRPLNSERKLLARIDAFLAREGKP